MAHVSNTFKEVIVTGGKYYAKTGHDSNNGNTPDTPYLNWRSDIATVSPNYSRVNIIGSGHYRSSVIIGYSLGGVGARYQEVFKGDGKVFIDFLGVTGRLAVNASFDNLTLKNTTSSTATGTLNNTGTGVWFKNCVLDTISLGYLTTSSLVTTDGYLHKLEKVIAINCAWPATGLTVPTPAVYRVGILSSILKGSSVDSGVYRVSRLINSYVHTDVVVQFNIAASAPVPQRQWSDPSLDNQLGYCNIRGLILMQGVYYAVQDALTGTPQDNGYASGVRWLNESELTSAGFTGVISGWNAVVATLMNRDPDFINIDDNYFGLRQSSPHIGAGYDGTNIGGTAISDFIGVNEDGVDDKTVILSAEIDSTDPTDVQLDLTEEEGTINFINYINGPMGKIDLDIDYLFDSDEAGGDANNNNVPDAEPSLAGYPVRDITTSDGTSTTTYRIASAGTPSIGNWTRVLGEVREITNVQDNTPSAGIKTVTVASAFRATIPSGTIVTYGTRDQIALMSPNRLCVLMRTSSNADTDPPDTEADWDNLGFGDPEVYYLQELEKVPGLYNVAGTWYGAGDSLRPEGGTFKPILNCWFDAKVVLINRFSHDGLA